MTFLGTNNHYLKTLPPIILAHGGNKLKRFLKQLVKLWLPQFKRHLKTLINYG